jgi:hypothetical protein
MKSIHARRLEARVTVFLKLLKEFKNCVNT